MEVRDGRESAAVAAGVLILLDLPQPSNYAAERTGTAIGTVFPDPRTARGHRRTVSLASG